VSNDIIRLEVELWNTADARPKSKRLRAASHRTELEDSA
jgi:hypothetical protein